MSINQYEIKNSNPHTSFPFVFLFILCSVSILRGQLDSSSDYSVYYGAFGDNEVLKTQYFDLIILDVRSINPNQVADIKNGFDNITGTDDDVMVIGYLSIGEQDGNLVQGDGSGPVYWNGSEIISQNNGYASFYLDDKDKDGIPDKDGTWNSYYVNAGDSAWWQFNRPLADDIIITHKCDGLFLDLVDTGGPNSWGLSYQWTAEGMIQYIEYLRKTYPDKYILANRGVFYFDPSLPNHYKYSDRYRKNIDGLMIESYYAIWNWNQSIGVYNTGFPYLRDYFAPLLNLQSNQPDGFNIFILDYLKLNQSNYSVLLDNVVKVTERDQGWLVAVSTIFLDSIRYDTYHHHLVDKNPPSWSNEVGISRYKWNGDDLEIFWDKAIDQTPPVKYHLYLNETGIDFASPAQYPNLTPLISETSDYKFIIEGLDNNKTYYAGLKASDSFSSEHFDPNLKVVDILPGGSAQIIVDGYFEDWTPVNQVDLHGDYIELEGDTAVSKSCDLIDLWFSQDANALYFSFSVGGPIMAPPYYYHVFIDQDNNPETGYHSNGSAIGIDMMCENGYLWRYNGTSGEWAWEYIAQISYMIGITNNNQAEFSIPKIYLPENTESISYIYHINDSNAEIDDDYAPNNYGQYAYNDILVNVNDEPKISISKELKIECSVYPNPFNLNVTFSGNLNKVIEEDLEILIFDIMGQLIHKNIVAKAGTSEINYLWNTGSEINQELASGVYLFRIEGKKERVFYNGKLIYLK